MVANPLPLFGGGAMGDAVMGCIGLPKLYEGGSGGGDADASGEDIEPREML